MQSHSPAEPLGIPKPYLVPEHHEPPDYPPTSSFPPPTTSDSHGHFPEPNPIHFMLLPCLLQKFTRIYFKTSRQLLTSTSTYVSCQGTNYKAVCPKTGMYSVLWARRDDAMHCHGGAEAPWTSTSGTAIFKEFPHLWNCPSPVEYLCGCTKWFLPQREGKARQLRNTEPQI